MKLDKSEKYPEENVLPEDGLYRHLYQPGEQHGEQKRQSTDIIKSKTTSRLDQIAEKPGSHVLHYLPGRPDRAFVREKLMRIPKDTQVPLEWVSISFANAVAYLTVSNPRGILTNAK